MASPAAGGGPQPPPEHHPTSGHPPSSRQAVPQPPPPSRKASHSRLFAQTGHQAPATSKTLHGGAQTSPAASVHAGDLPLAAASDLDNRDPHARPTSGFSPSPAAADLAVGMGSHRPPQPPTTSTDGAHPPPQPTQPQTRRDNLPMAQTSRVAPSTAATLPAVGNDPDPSGPSHLSPSEAAMGSMQSQPPPSSFTATGFVENPSLTHVPCTLPAASRGFDLHADPQLMSSGAPPSPTTTLQPSRPVAVTDSTTVQALLIAAYGGSRLPQHASGSQPTSQPHPMPPNTSNPWPPTNPHAPVPSHAAPNMQHPPTRQQQARDPTHAATAGANQPPRPTPASRGSNAAQKPSCASVLNPAAILNPSAPPRPQKSFLDAVMGATEAAVPVLIF